jgi:hypothetical protein
MKIKKHARDEAKLLKIVDMVYGQKMTLKAVANVFHVSKQAIGSLLKHAGYSRRPYLSDKEVDAAYKEYIADPDFASKPHDASCSTYIRYFKSKGLTLRVDMRPKYTKEYIEKAHKKYMESGLSLINFGKRNYGSSSTLTKYFAKFGLGNKKVGWVKGRARKIVKHRRRRRLLKKRAKHV